LTHANAGELSVLITKIFASTIKKGARQSAKIRILSDKRTNSLILIGHPISLEKIKSLIKQLDNGIETDEGNIRVYPLRNANAKKVSEVLQKIAGTLKSPKKQMKGKATIIPDIPSNSLVIYADQADFPTLENVIKKLDVERAQVFIQAIIMEVSLNKSLDLGIEWQSGDLKSVGGTDAMVTIGSVGSTGRPKALASVVSNKDAAGAMIGVIGGPITFGGTQYSSFHTFIKALAKDTEIDILSNPQILTLNNEEAEIKVGEIIPTVGSTKTDANGNTTTSIDYKEVGISLKITPQVNMNNSIELKIDETSSHVIVGKSDALSNQGAITTLNRSLKTKVVIEDGQTIALGGLISDESTQEEMKTPCLGDIPILGWIFKTRSDRIRKTNLLVFLTPKVVRSKKDLALVTDKAKARMRAAQKGRFRIDVSKEFNIPVNSDDSDEEEEVQEPEKPVETESSEAKDETTNVENAE
jgi:general secretion pathway protein D